MAYATKTTCVSKSSLAACPNCESTRIRPHKSPKSPLKLAHKDMSLATTLGRELGVPMRLANLPLEEMAEALGRGFGAQDSRSFLKLQLERAGVEIAVDPDRLREAVKAL